MPIAVSGRERIGYSSTSRLVHRTILKCPDWKQTLDPPHRSPYWHDEKQLEAEAYAWFDDLFYDPEAERAAGITRRYRWLPQDTIEPYEVLQSRYGKTMSPWLIRDMSERLSKTSSNWRSRPDEFSNIDERPRAHASTIRPNEVEVEREALLAAIAALEVAVAAIRNPKPLFGHNMPPEGLDDDPVSRQELTNLVVTINQARDFNPDLKALAVLNRVPTNVFSDSDSEARTYLADFPELRIARTKLHERKVYQTSVSEGLGVVEMKDSKAKREIQLLTEEVLAW